MSAFVWFATGALAGELLILGIATVVDARGRASARRQHTKFRNENPR